MIDNHNDNEEGGGKLVRVNYFHCSQPNCDQKKIDCSADRIRRPTSLIKRHLWLVHDIPATTRECFSCMQHYDKNQFDEHLLMCNPSVGSFKCAKCDTCYINYQTLSNHYYAVHLEGSFSCTVPQCDYTGSFRANVYQHYHDKHRPISCSFEGCTETFRYKSHLRLHNLNVHLKVALYKCTWANCQWAGSSKRYDVKEHVKEHIKRMQHAAQEGAVVDLLDPEQFIEKITFIEAMQNAGKFEFEIE